MERGKYTKSRSMSGSCTYAGRDIPKNQCPIFLYKENRTSNAWFKKPSGVEVEMMWGLQIYIVYGIENGIANIILCLHQSIEEKYFITKKESNRRNIEKIVCMERDKYTKSRSISRSCTYAGRDIPKNQCPIFLYRENRTSNA